MMNAIGWVLCNSIGRLVAQAAGVAGCIAVWLYGCIGYSPVYLKLARARDLRGYTYIIEKNLSGHLDVSLSDSLFL